MNFDQLFLLTAQSSLFLGLIHGINPCGHSWLVIAPFVTGTKDGKRAFLMTFSFLLGTIVACLLIGLTLGAVSMLIPESFTDLINYFTAGLIIVLGAILIIKPHLLHHHDHDHDHDHDHHHHGDEQSNDSHNHSHCCHHNDSEHHGHEHDKELNHEDHHHHSCESGCATHRGALSRWWESLRKRISLSALFLIGFVNMIIPCPTVSIMYKYAVDSGSYIKATTIFGLYAVSTSITVGLVIFAIFKTTQMFYLLQKPWIESLIMRTAGVLTVFFGVWSLY